MPPANSPVEASTPADRQNATGSPVSFNALINELASPVPDYASTLNYRPDDDVDSANVDFLRHYARYYQGVPELTGLDPIATATSTGLPDSRQSITTERVAQPRSLGDERVPDHSTRSEWRRARLARHAPSAPSHGGSASESRPQEPGLDDATATDPASTAPYGENVPNQQSLYDWAPIPDEIGADELDLILAELRRSQPNTHPDVLRSLARTDLEAARDARPRHSSQRTLASQQDSSLRPAAMLQSIRRHWRISQQTRMLMTMLTSERERASQNAFSSPSPSSSSPPSSTYPAPAPLSSSLNPNSDPPPPESNNTSSGSQPTDENSSGLDSFNRRDNRIQSRRYPRNTTLAELGRRVCEEDLTEFSEAIQFWCRLCCSSKSVHDTTTTNIITAPAPAPPVPSSLESVGPIPVDILRPPATSWLVPGVTFTGEQQAVPLSTSSSHRHNARNPSDSHPDSSARQRFPALPNRWPVKLAIHAVDYQNMILQGTMEAFNVPSAPTPPPSPGTTNSPGPSEEATCKTTFSTYVEGEIIDFSIHPLQTECGNFGVKTTPDVDAKYWRRLEPFVSLQPAELGEALRDPEWIKENLTKKYILMRWKERSFVRPTFTSFSTMGVSRIGRSGRSSGGVQPHNYQDTRHSSHVEPARRPTPPHPLESAMTTFLSSADGNGYGLSISGYYYVSMRRSDGKCEGLYYDPASAPFQRLDLTPTVGTWGCGTWEFR